MQAQSRPAESCSDDGLLRPSPDQLKLAVTTDCCSMQAQSRPAGSCSNNGLLWQSRPAESCSRGGPLAADCKCTPHLQSCSDDTFSAARWTLAACSVQTQSQLVEPFSDQCSSVQTQSRLVEPFSINTSTVPASGAFQ